MNTIYFLTRLALHDDVSSKASLVPPSVNLAYVSSDPKNLTPLTPNHFVVGQLGGQFAPEIPHIDAINPQKRWHRIQQLLGQFWKRWRREFQPNLNIRRKWFHPRRNLKEGDIVLLIGPKAHRGDWPLGRIVGTHTGADGLVIVTRVRVGKNEYLRPVNRLCPLEHHVQEH